MLKWLKGRKEPKYEVWVRKHHLATFNSKEEANEYIVDLFLEFRNTKTDFKTTMGNLRLFKYQFTIKEKKGK